MAFRWWLVPLAAALAAQDSGPDRIVADIDYGPRLTPGDQFSPACAVVSYAPHDIPALLLAGTGFARLFLTESQRMTLSTGAYVWLGLYTNNTHVFHMDFDIVDRASGAVLRRCAPACLTIDKNSFRIRVLNTTVVDTGPLASDQISQAQWRAAAVVSHEGVELLWMGETLSFAKSDQARAAVTQALRAAKEPGGTLAFTMRVTREGAANCSRAPDKMNWGAAVMRVVASSLCTDSGCSLCSHISNCDWDDTGQCDNKGCSECQPELELLPRAVGDDLGNMLPVCFPRERPDLCHQSWTERSCTGQGPTCRWCAMREACLNSTVPCPSICSSEAESSCNGTHWCHWRGSRCEGFERALGPPLGDGKTVVWARNYSLPGSADDAALTDARHEMPMLRIGAAGIASYVINGSETRSLRSGFVWRASISPPDAAARLRVRLSTGAGGATAECVPFCLDLGNPAALTVGNATKRILDIPFGSATSLIDVKVLVQESTFAVSVGSFVWNGRLDTTEALSVIGHGKSTVLSLRASLAGSEASAGGLALEVAHVSLARLCMVDNCRQCSTLGSCSVCDEGYVRSLTPDASAFVCACACDGPSTETTCLNASGSCHWCDGACQLRSLSCAQRGGRSHRRMVVAIVASFATAGPAVAVAAGVAVFLVGRRLRNPAPKEVDLLAKEKQQRGHASKS
eukprot:m51a1_g3111 hypothetical protein (686) ;mRNA; f:150285-152562